MFKHCVGEVGIQKWFLKDIFLSYYRKKKVSVFGSSMSFEDNYTLYGAMCLRAADCSDGYRLFHRDDLPISVNTD